MYQNNDYTKSWGLTGHILNLAAAHPALFPARISSAHKGLYRALTEHGEVLAQVSGKLRHQAVDATDLPAVGDFVLLDRSDHQGGHAVVQQILPRTSLFTRKAAGTGGGIQVLAANIDFTLVCMSLNRDFNLRRLERYLSVAWNSGATPVVVLTKRDLCHDLDARLADAASVAVGVEVVCTSSLEGDGIELVQPYVSNGHTAVFLGSSGVGKSTLINHLLNHEQLATAPVRDSDDRGRHTTTHRELIPLTLGGCVIDTPGIRELGLDSADLDRSFADIANLAATCRFRDCTHKSEPGCGVREAVELGSLSAERLENYHKLQRELGYEGLDSRQIEDKKLKEMFSGYGGVKNARRYLQDKNRLKGRER